MEKTPLESRAHLEALLARFYERVRADPLIGPVFNDQAKVNWAEHLPKIEKFWASLLFSENSYHGRPFPPHMQFELRGEHFSRWLELFRLTVDEAYIGPRAEELKERAIGIGRIFLARIEAYREAMRD